MAINTTGNNGSVIGVTGVHPDNIGKGIKWNDTTKKYEVDVKEDSGIIINELGELEVRVSELEDNALRVVDGKLYYGTRARAELANLYVDAINGVDQDPLKVSGAGTKQKPLKTLAYAINLGETNTYRNIWIKEKQAHTILASEHVTAKSGTLNIKPYGETLDSYSAVLPTMSEAFNKLVDNGFAPNIVLKGYRLGYNHLSTHAYFHFDCILLNDCKLRLDGVSLVNDLNTTLEPVTQDSTSIAVYCRIQGTGEFYMVRSHLKSYGTLVNNAGVPSTIDTNKNLSFVGFVQNTQLNINLYENRNNIETDVNCYILTPSGSKVASNTTTTLNALANSEDNKKAIAKRTYNPIKFNVGNGQVVVIPNTSIKYEYF